MFLYLAYAIVKHRQ